MGTGKIVFRALLMTALLAFRTSAAEADADGSARAARMARGGIEIACESFTLRFASDGLPTSLRSNRSGEELLNTREPGKGFQVLNRVSLATGARPCRGSSVRDAMAAQSRFIFLHDIPPSQT